MRATKRSNIMDCASLGLDEISRVSLKQRRKWNPQITCREKLVCDNLDLCDERTWEHPGGASSSVLEALRHAPIQKLKCAFLTENRMLTTNLARATALRTQATKQGEIRAQNEPVAAMAMMDGLSTFTSSLGISHKDCSVLVACRRDYDAALLIGMHQRFVDETSQSVDGSRTVFPVRRRGDALRRTSADSMWRGTERNSGPCHRHLDPELQFATSPQQRLASLEAAI